MLTILAVIGLVAAAAIAVILVGIAAEIWTDL